MKNLHIILIILIVIQITAAANAPVNNQKIHPELMEQMALALANDSQNTIRAIVVLKEQYHPSEIQPMVHIDGKQHRKEVINSMKQQSSRSQRSINAMLYNMGPVKVKNIRPLWIVNAIGLEATPDVIEALSRREDVADIIPDFEVHLLEPPVVQGVASAQSTTAWGVEMIRAPEVWKLRYNGSGINVSIIDTGIDASHPDLDDLDDNVSTSDPKVIKWIDYVNGSSVPYDDNGHGTHVAGTVSGTGAGGIQTGVAPGTNLLVAKVLDSNGSGNLIDLYSAAEWSIENGADVISLSLGSDSHLQIMTAMVNNTVAAGVVPVIAAGNGGPNSSTITCPGDEFNATTVGATDSSDSIAWFSSRGPVTWVNGTYIKPDVTAPGTWILSAKAAGIPDSYYWGNYSEYYAYLGGTSMATPHVSGAVALILQAYPDMKPLEVRQLLEDTALDLGPVGKDNDYGSGRIDVLAAILQLPLPPEISNITIYPNPTNMNPVLNASISDIADNISYAEFYIDDDFANATQLNAVDGAFDSKFENVTGMINISNLSDGIYTVTIRAKDSLNNWNNKTNTSFFVDTTPPQISNLTIYPNPTNINSTINATVYDYLHNISYAEFYIDDDFANATQLNAVDGAFDSKFENVTGMINISNLSDGIHTVTIRANDSLNNWNNKTNTSFFVDTTPPLIVLNSPDNNSFIQSGTIINLTITDQFLANVTYSINSTLTNYTNITNATFDVPFEINTSDWNESTYDIIVWANDSLGNENSRNYRFVIDDTPPNITVVSHNASGILDLNDVLGVNMTGDAGIKNATFEIEGVIYNQSMIETTSGNYSGNYTVSGALEVKNTAVTCYLTDAAGNVNNSTASTKISIDTLPPRIILESPANNSFIQNGTILNFTISDIFLANVTYSINSSQANYSNFTNKTFNISYKINTTGWNESEYDITIWANDSLNHINSTDYHITIDDTPPNLTIVNPTADYSTSDSTVTISGTTDPDANITINNELVTSKNGSFSVEKSLTLGSNIFTINATDKAGNINSTTLTVSRYAIVSSNGGGGGGSGISGEDFNNIAKTQTQRATIFKGDHVSYAFEIGINPIQYINFTAKVSAGKVAARIEVLRNTSTLVDKPAPGLVYKNINIWVGNYGWASEKSITNATISFTVSREWIETYNIDDKSITLYRYVSHSWNPLPTTETGRDDSNIYYISAASGFSPFAISGEPIPSPTLIQTAVPTSMPIKQADISITDEPHAPQAIELHNGVGKVLFWILFIIIILSVMAAAYARKDDIQIKLNDLRHR